MRTPLYKGNQVSAIDQSEIALGTPGIELMRRAGKRAFDCITSLWPDCSELVVFCGAGNNAGDGYVVAALAYQCAFEVSVFYLKPPEELRGDAAIVAQEVLELGIPCAPFAKGCAGFRPQERTAVWVDSLLGTGFSGELSAPYIDAIHYLNRYNHPVFAIDLPSGVYTDSGGIASCAVRADATMSFIGRKRGLYTGEGKARAGKVYFDDLCAQAEAYRSQPSHCFLLEPGSLFDSLGRNINSHKGSHGHVAVVGGAAGSVGASILSAEASLRSGAGLTSLYTHADGVAAALTRLPEVMSTAISDNALVDKRFSLASVFCLGPGMGLDGEAQDVAKRAIKHDCPMVLDADALTLLARGDLDKPKGRGNVVITPHPGEAARLLKLSSAQVQHDRFDAVLKLAQNYQCVAVLKGAGTLISDGETVWVCEAGNPGMAVGGMGDILAGVIAALLAQGLSALCAAQLGVWAHSRAGDILADQNGPIGLAASDLVPIIRKILNAKTI